MALHGKFGVKITTAAAPSGGDTLPVTDFTEEHMAKKRDTRRTDPELQDAKALSRRDFFARGAAAGVGATVLSGPGEAHAQGIVWN
jgi:hypothetical protein